MNVFYQFGAMYAEVKEGDQIINIPVELGDKFLSPGEYISRIGEKKRTSFSMQEGYYLRYVGKCENYLLFFTNAIKEDEPSNIYYAFAYVDKNTLVIGGAKGCRDIRVEKLEVFNVVPYNPIKKQMSLF